MDDGVSNCRFEISLTTLVVEIDPLADLISVASVSTPSPSRSIPLSSVFAIHPSSSQEEISLRNEYPPTFLGDLHDAPNFVHVWTLDVPTLVNGPPGGNAACCSSSRCCSAGRISQFVQCYHFCLASPDECHDLATFLYGHVFLDGSAPSSPSVLPHRRTLLVVNPVSGPTGLTPHLLQTEILPLLSLSNLSYELLETTHASHASEIGESFDVDSFTDVAIMGGDGTVWEFLQGFIRNPNLSPDDLKKIPIGHIPAGTGNGIAANSGTNNDPLVGAFIVARGKFVAWDAMSVFHRQERFFCVLQISYAIIADVENGMRWLRRTGFFRYIAGTFWNLLKNNHYSVRLKYVLTGEVEEEHEGEENSSQSLFSRIQSSDFRNFEPSDELPPTPQLHEFFSLDLLSLQQQEDSESTLPSPSDDEDPQIQLYEGPIFLSIFSNLPRIGFNFWGSPRQALSSGSIDLVQIRHVGQCQAFNTLSTLSHLVSDSADAVCNDSLLEFVRMTAFVFVPLEVEESHLTLDGERIEVDTIIVEVHPSLLSLFVL